MKPQPFSELTPHQKLAHAWRAGRGVRLSADEVHKLYRRDTAIETVADDDDHAYRERASAPQPQDGQAEGKK